MQKQGSEGVRLQQGEFGRVLILGSRLGHLPCVQQGQVLEGSTRAGNSCLLTAASTSSTTQPLAPCLQVLLVGGLHLSSHTFPPYLHMGSPRSARGSSVPPVWQWFCCGLRCAQLATTRAAPRQSKNKVQQFLHCRGRPGQGVAACLLSFMLNCSQSTVLI